MEPIMEPIFNFACTTSGFIILISILVVSVVFCLHFNRIEFISVAFVIGYVLANAHPPKEETPTVNTQESTQVKVKENNINLNCTALENGKFFCEEEK